MPTISLRLGLPRHPFSRAQEPPARLDFPDPFSWRARNLVGWRFDSPQRLAPTFNHSILGGAAPNTSRITGLFAVNWGDGDSDTLRLTAASIHELLGGVWTDIEGAAAISATDADYWGGAVVQDDAATNPGKGIFLTSCRNAGEIYFWTGTGNISNTWLAGSPDPGKYIVSFANRAFIFNQIVGGGIRGRRGQWSLPGQARSWTGTGASFREFTEFDSDITGAFTLRGNLYVSSERSLLVGQDTFSARGPVRYYPVTSNGIGIFAPRSLVGFEDRVAFLSQQGFVSFDGQAFTDIGGPSFNSFVTSSINRAKLETISGAHLPAPFNLLIWALPLNGAPNPEYLYAYDYINDIWHFMGSSTTFFSGVNVSAHCLTTSIRSSAVPWSGLVGTWAAQTLRWSDFGGAAGVPSLLSGHTGGQVRITDSSTTNTGVLLQLDTPILTFANVPIGDRRIRLEDFKELDAIEVTYFTGRDKSATSLMAFTSVDEGRTFTHFGTVSLNMSSSLVSRTIRIDPITPITGRSFIIRLTTQGVVDGSFISYRPSMSLDDIWVRIRLKGEERDEL